MQLKAIINETMILKPIFSIQKISRFDNVNPAKININTIAEEYEIKYNIAGIR